MKTKNTRLRIVQGGFLAAHHFLLHLFVGIAFLISGWRASAASLENQWKYLPEVQVKPEGSAMGLPPPVKGGNEWKKAAQTPDLVPVKLSGLFKADYCAVTFSLAGVSVSEFDWYDAGAPEHPFVETGTTNVNLKPYQTYTLRMIGDSVYHAEAILEPPSLNDLFSSPTMAQQPARVYKMYIWNTNTMAWEKLCSQNVPEFGVDSWDPMDVQFLVQVRPDLGARPVTKPGVRGASGEDQGDDAWTRDEPAIDANTAPGDGDTVEMASSRMGDPASVRFSWSAYMGRLWSGAGAGKIRLSEFGFTTNTYTPRVLNYSARSSDTNEITVIMDLDDTNNLTQVKAPQYRLP